MQTSTSIAFHVFNFFPMTICDMGIHRNGVWGKIMKNKQALYILAIILKTLDLLNMVWDNLSFSQNMK